MIQGPAQQCCLQRCPGGQAAAAAKPGQGGDQDELSEASPRKGEDVVYDRPGILPNDNREINECAARRRLRVYVFTCLPGTVSYVLDVGGFAYPSSYPLGVFTDSLSLFQKGNKVGDLRVLIHTSKRHGTFFGGA